MKQLMKNFTIIFSLCLLLSSSSFSFVSQLVVFTIRDENVRLIGLRKANTREVKQYEKKPKNISQKDWNEAEIPELTTSEMSKLRPAKEVLPEVVAAYNSGTLKRKQGQRGSQKSPTKQAVSIRLSTEVVDFFKKGGKGWQTRVDDVLREYVGSH